MSTERNSYELTRFFLFDILSLVTLSVGISKTGRNSHENQYKFSSLVLAWTDGCLFSDKGQAL